jgi:hypothetical protein
MSRTAHDLTGQWHGEYAYPRHQAPVTPFVAAITEHDGHIGGTVMEIDPIDGSTLESVLFGKRREQSVSFTKTYDRTGTGHYEEPVDYVGTLSDDGNVIAGIWSLSVWDGTFEMRREVEAGDVIEETIGDRVPALSGR